MKKIICGLMFISVLFLLYGCAAVPIKREVSLPSQVIGHAPTSPDMLRLVIFNNSNYLLYGIDGSGKINISIDGKGVGQLSIGKYVVIEVSEDRHMVHLMHKDVVDFNSNHAIDVKEPESYLKIYSTTIANGAEIVKKPDNFEAEFVAAY